MHGMIAQRLFSRCVIVGDAWESETGIPRPDDVCVSQRDKWYLDVRRFAEWLTRQPTEGLDVERVALFAAAFAILQPADAAPICTALLKSDNRYRSLVLDGNLDDQPGATDSLKEPDGSVMAHDELEHQVKDLADQVQRLAPTASELAVDTAAAADLLEREQQPLTEELMDRLGAFAEQHASVWTTAIDLGRELGIEPPSLESANHTRKQLDDLVSELTAAVGRRKHNAAMAERVGRACSTGSRLTCPSGPSVLSPVFDRIRHLKEHGADGASDTDAFEAQLMGLEKLLKFVSNLRQLEHVEWKSLEHDVIGEFGKDLATVVVRGQIALADVPAEFPTSSTNTCSDRHETCEDQSTMCEPSGDDGYESDERSDAKTQHTIPSLTTSAGEAHDAEPPEEDAGDSSATADSTATNAFSMTAEVPPGEKDGKGTTTVDMFATAPDTPSTSGAKTRATDSIEATIWELVGTGRLSLAYQIALRTALRECTDDVAIPVWLLRALAIEPFLRQPAGVIATQVQADFAEFTDRLFTEGQAERNQAMRLLLAAAALRPALLAPVTGASSILHNIHWPSGLDTLFKICHDVGRYSERMQPLDVTILKRLKNRAAWEEAAQALQRQMDAWCKHAPRMTMKFAPATKVWLRWQEPGGLIHTLLAPARADDTSQLRTVAEAVHRVSEETALRKEIDQTDALLRGRKANRISAGALQHLFRQTKEALSLARRWVELHSDNPELNNQSHYNETVTLVRNLREYLIQSTKDLSPLAANPASKPVEQAARCCLRAIEGVATILDPAGALRTDEPLLEDILETELLAAPDLLVSTSSASDNLSALRQLAEEPLTDWSAAFDRQLEAQRLDLAQRIRRLAESAVISIDDHGSYAERLERRQLECMGALCRAIEATQNQVEAAVGTGLLPEAQRDSLCARIQHISQAVRRTLDFPAAHALLKAIHAELESRRTAGVRSACRRVEAELPNITAEGRQRIDEALAAGDVATANDYIDVLCRGEHLPEAAKSVDTFIDFAVDKHDGLVEALESKSRAPKQLIEDVQHTRSIGPLRLSDITGAQAKEAANMVKSWLKLKSEQSITQPSMRTLLSALGFVPTSLAISKQGRQRAWIDLEAETIADRDLCAVHEYGSRARGRYRVYCAWGRPNEEDLLYEIGDTANAPPAIVFFFGRLTLRQKRNLAQLCVEKHRTVTVVDETLILYLCGVRGSRTSSLFECAIPFTFVNEAYVTTASLVPPELFYGRRRERASIIDPMGTCFIFGGRQLGKTALLRGVARSFEGDGDRLAIWLDLKGEGIGYDRSPDAIWDLLREHLQRREVIPAKLPPHTGPDRVFEHVRSWLDGNLARRILFLLDEADRFLEADGRDEFVRSTRIKALMDRTERRFKVVFAGLHNVQRTTRLANHPLAHYGEPICIGPLLEGGEWREARSLIEKPLNMLGYRFESPDLITRILSRTNYYPSLIQLYCSHLLRYLTNPQIVHFDSSKCPPYTITSTHVDKVYESQNLRHEIRKRFMLTLELDPRYEVIALAIALYTVETESAHREGFDVEWIWGTARTFWPAGFDEIRSYDAFKSLLDEMTGLGVLRQVNSHTYALRSPNVVSLLGTEQEIERELDSCSALDPPVEYEASVFRSALRTERGPDNSRRNPLTASQESSLAGRQHGITVVYGTQAAGLCDLRTFVQARFGDGFVLVESSDLGEFTRLTEDFARARSEGTSVVFLGAEIPWTSDWVDAASEFLNRLKSKSAFLRVLFEAGAARTWQCVRQGLPWGELAATMSLSPWHYDALRQWLTDNGFANPTEEERGLMRAVTGHWAGLLSELLKSCGKDRGHLLNRLRDLEARFSEDSFIATLCSSFGLTSAPCEEVLRAIGTFGPVEIGEIQEVVENSSSRTVSQVFQWAESLCLIKRESEARFSLDRVVSRALRVPT